MSQVTSNYTELLSQLMLLANHQQSSLSLPEIKETPSDQTAVFSFCKAIMNEGSRHSDKLWAAHMTTSASSASILGQVLAGLHNGNLLSASLYPLLHEIEQQLLTWFCQLFHQPHGHFTAGASYANLEALWQAREQSPHSSNVVYGSQATHYSVAKACQILGLEFQAIATDEFDRILPSALELACHDKLPTAIVLTAGTTAAGEIDPMKACLAIAKTFNCWCHIDAAWGGALALLQEHQVLISEMDQADSICVDPHKAFGQPKPCGLLMYQRPRKALFETSASYLEDQPKQTLSGSYGGELFLSLWSNIMLNGVGSLREQIQQPLVQAGYFAEQLKKYSDWWLHHSQTGIVCFQPSESSNELDILVEQGLFSRAKVNGREVYRAVFTPNTQSEVLITALEPFF